MLYMNNTKKPTSSVQTEAIYNNCND